MKLDAYLRERIAALDESESLADDATLVADYNADPRNWRTITSPEVLAWMGGSARKRRLERWAASVPADDPREEAASGIETVFIAAANDQTGVKSVPGSKDRLLIDALPGLGVVTQDEVDELLAKGFLGEADTDAAAMAAARAAIDRESAVRKASDRLDAARQAGASAVDASDPIDWQAVRDAVVAVADGWIAE